MKDRRALVRFQYLVMLILLTVVELVSAAPVRIGYYGGTFDPPTLGHRDLVVRAIQEASLDFVVVMPSITNSHKPNATPFPLRLEMVRLNFLDLPQVIVADSEMEIAFTQDRANGVMRLIQQRFPENQLFRITGDDVVSRNFSTEMIQDSAFQDVGLIIGERSGRNQSIAEDRSSFDFTGREVIILPVTTDQGISSSLVKELIRANAPEAEIPLHPRVLNFIRDHGLYELPQSCEAVLFQAS